MEKIKVLQGIDTVIVRVSDINKSSAWYQDKLELGLIWEDRENRLVVLDTGSSVSLTLWQTEEKINPGRETASYPIFRTSDARIARQELQSRGVSADEVCGEVFLFL